MKMKRFSVQFGLSFALISGYLTLPTQLVQAQVASDSDITTDGSDMAPGLLPSIKIAIASDRIFIYVSVTSNNILERLERGTYFDPNVVSSEVQERLAAVFTNPTSEDQEFLVGTLVINEISPSQATELIEIITGLFSEIEKVTSSSSEVNSQRSNNWIASTAPPSEAVISQADNATRNFQDDLDLRIDQAEKLDKAIKRYNRWIASLDRETLQNPPASLQIIRQVLLDASDATRSGDE